MTHSDDNGLVLPSPISPIQVQIIQVKNTEEIEQVSKDIKSQLGYLRVGIDNTDKSFGFKISEAEIKGIPVRIEVGPRDLENNEVTISRRDDQTNKVKVKLEDIAKTVNEMIEQYDKSLFAKALENRKNRTSSAETFDEYMEKLKTNQGFVLVPFCGRIECEDDVKAKSSTNSRCIPFGVEQTHGKCFNCGRDSELRVYFARAY